MPTYAAIHSPQPHMKEALLGTRIKRAKRGNIFIPAFPCPSDLQVSVGNSLVRPAPGTDLAGTGFGIAACGSRQEEEQPQQFCVQKKQTATWSYLLEFHTTKSEFL